MSPANQSPRREESDEQLQSEWAARQQALGNVPQAVLLRNLPVGINLLLDTWHRTLLRWSFSPLMREASTDWIADLGCGYGRMASEVKNLGFSNVVGLDYESGFCRQYQHDHGSAVRGSIEQPPFSNGSLIGAYAITAFMYVGTAGAREGLRRLDASLLPGARILLLEAGAEFNNAARLILRRKKTQSLAVDGFSQLELGETLLPDGWKVTASGSNIWMTALLPLLLAFSRWPRILAAASALIMRLDRPQPGLRDCGWRRFALHRWVLCEKPLNVQPSTQHLPGDFHSNQI